MTHVVECAVSLDFLLRFSSSVPDGYSTAQVVQNIVVPSTRNQRCRYVALESMPVGSVGRSQHFVSHRWAADFVRELVALVCGHFADAADAEDAAKGRVKGKPLPSGAHPAAFNGIRRSTETAIQHAAGVQPPYVSSDGRDVRSAPLATAAVPAGAGPPNQSTDHPAFTQPLPMGREHSSPLTRPHSLRVSSRLGDARYPGAGAGGTPLPGDQLPGRTSWPGHPSGSLGGGGAGCPLAESVSLHPAEVPLPGSTTHELDMAFPGGGSYTGACDGVCGSGGSLNPLHAGPPCSQPLPPWPHPRPQSLTHLQSQTQLQRQLSRGPSRTSRGSVTSIASCGSAGLGGLGGLGGTSGGGGSGGGSITSNGTYLRARTLAGLLRPQHASGCANGSLSAGPACSRSSTPASASALASCTCGSASASASGMVSSGSASASITSVMADARGGASRTGYRANSGTGSVWTSRTALGAVSSAVGHPSPRDAGQTAPAAGVMSLHGRATTDSRAWGAAGGGESGGGGGGGPAVSFRQRAPSAGGASARRVAMSPPANALGAGAGSAHSRLSPGSSSRNAALVEQLLSRFAGREELLERTYVWLDIFAINQHPGAAQADDLSKLQEVVGASEATLLVLDARGMVLTRIWCLYEIWQTVRQRGPKGLRVLAGPLRQEELARVWGDLDVERAEATVPADRDRILADIRTSTGSDPLNAHIKRAIVESATLQLETARAAAPRSPAHAERAHAAAALLRTSGQHSEALAAAAEAAEVAAEACGPHHPTTLRAMRTLAGCHKDLGSAQLAADMLREQVIPFLDTAYGPGHHEYDAVWDLGMLQYTLGQYDAAYGTLLAALLQQLRALHAAAPAATPQLGPLLAAAPPTAAADPLFIADAEHDVIDGGVRLALTSAAAPPPPTLTADQLPTVLAAVRSLVEMLGGGESGSAAVAATGEAGEASESEGREAPAGGRGGSSSSSIALRQAVGEWGERVGLTLHSLGLVQKERCRVRAADGAALLREARELMEASVELLDAFSSSDRGMAALDARANLAGLALEGGDLQSAERLLRSTLALTESVYGPDHHHTATALNNLAVCLKRLRSPAASAEAVCLYRRCLALCGCALGEAHPETLVVATNLGVLLADLRQLSESESLLSRAVACLPAQLGEGHPDVLAAYRRLAQLLEARNKLFESEAMFGVALAAAESAPPDCRDHGAVLECREGLERVRGLLEEAARREREASGCCVVS